MSRGKEFIKLDDGEKADLYFKKPAARVSYASVVTQSKETEHYVDISVSMCTMLFVIISLYIDTIAVTFSQK